MKTQPIWLSTNGIDPENFRALNVAVRHKMGQETKGWLEVESANNDGQITVSANFNSSPFANSVSLARFYLTQEQLNEVMNKGPKTVLIAPA